MLIKKLYRIAVYIIMKIIYVIKARKHEQGLHQQNNKHHHRAHFDGSWLLLSAFYMAQPVLQIGSLKSLQRKEGFGVERLDFHCT